MIIQTPPDFKLANFDRLIEAYLGGPEVCEMLASHISGRSYREIADYHGLNPGTVFNIIRLAKRRLAAAKLSLSDASLMHTTVEDEDA